LWGSVFFFYIKILWKTEKGGRRCASKSGSQNFETFGIYKSVKKNWVQDKLLFDAS
jgi:hypothetical protein